MTVACIAGGLDVSWKTANEAVLALSAAVFNIDDHLEVEPTSGLPAGL